MDGVYILRTFTSWYSITLSTGNEQYSQDSSEVFSEFKEFVSGYGTKQLWIDRSTCHITESLVSLTDEEPIEQTSINAFLGVVEVLNTYHLAVVVQSELVTELDLPNLSLDKAERGRIYTIKQARFFPINSSSFVYTPMNLVNVTNFGNLSNFTNLKNFGNVGNLGNIAVSGCGEQVELTTEVYRIIENLEKILSTGYFYSFDTDLTRSLQNLYSHKYFPINKSNPVLNTKSSDDSNKDKSSNEILYNISDEEYNWCYNMSKNIPKGWTTVLIQGFVGYITSEVDGDFVEILLIGRRNVKRSGTRFVARGIDEQGNTANSVETEMRVRINFKDWYSYVQCRGSVPIFWEQLNFTAPVNLYNHHLNIDAFSNHINQLKERYEPLELVLFINLLDIKDNERILTNSFQNLVQQYSRNNPVKSDNGSGDVGGMVKLVMENYNYNVNAKWCTNDVLIDYISENLLTHLNTISYFHETYGHKNDGDSGDRKVELQKGVVRTNCLDCLDRTNIFQYVLSWVIFNNILQNHTKRGFETGNKVSSVDQSQQLITPINNSGMDEDSELENNDLLNKFTQLWCDHGDYISIHYSGTQSTLSERVKQNNTSINSLLHYGKTMVQRVYSSVFQDSQRQQIYDILTSYNYNGVGREPLKRSLLYSKYYIQDPFSQADNPQNDSGLSDPPQGLNQGEGDEEDNLEDEDEEDEENIDVDLEVSSIFDRLNDKISKITGKSKPKPELLDFQPDSTDVKDGEYNEEMMRLNSDDLKVWFGSWNIGAHVVEVDDNLINWIELDTLQCDLYVFSFQEFVELNFINIATGKRDENKENEFERLIENVFEIATDEKYYKVSSIAMTGLYLVIYAKLSLKPHIKELLNTNVKTGLNLNIGNKGCVGIRFKIYDHHMSFLNLHLNFGKNLNISRIDLIDYVLKNSFKDHNISVLEDDLFVLGGDFNFRIQLDKDVVINHLKRLEFAKLFQYDEFNMSKMIGIPVLQYLNEPKIQFLPTYKYKDGTKFYTTKRSPAWCDRIIYGGKLNQKQKVHVLNYKRNDNLIMCSSTSSSSTSSLKLYLHNTTITTTKDGLIAIATIKVTKQGGSTPYSGDINSITANLGKTGTQLQTNSPLNGGDILNLNGEAAVAGSAPITIKGTIIVTKSGTLGGSLTLNGRLAGKLTLENGSGNIKVTIGTGNTLNATNPTNLELAGINVTGGSNLKGTATITITTTKPTDDLTNITGPVNITISKLTKADGGQLRVSTTLNQGDTLILVGTATAGTKRLNVSGTIKITGTGQLSSPLTFGGDITGSLNQFTNATDGVKVTGSGTLTLNGAKLPVLKNTNFSLTSDNKRALTSRLVTKSTISVGTKTNPGKVTISGLTIVPVCTTITGTSSSNGLKADLTDVTFTQTATGLTKYTGQNIDLSTGLSNATVEITKDKVKNLSGGTPLQTGTNLDPDDTLNLKITPQSGTGTKLEGKIHVKSDGKSLGNNLNLAGGIETSINGLNGSGGTLTGSVTITNMKYDPNEFHVNHQSDSCVLVPLNYI
ncbi:inositol phosphatase, putative [Theileria annulata]|uniref:phosphoinositide 5-phosphatase n=1 Tax=Theileria annulata TaxID=5874 RepID=Q4UIZ1_THEAN|nr:inositol phosphatase, putative [Theileria annulata]CAI72948.1 inositol phosphatase, putative [Theileria annulata]|eukprot:XP_953626.1 inositol phosphatase, putative [Theileria annulata]